MISPCRWGLVQMEDAAAGRDPMSPQFKAANLDPSQSAVNSGRASTSAARWFLPGRLTSSRKLPRQVETSKVNFAGASGLGRNASGGTWPRLSWGRSVL